MTTYYNSDYNEAKGLEAAILAVVREAQLGKCCITCDYFKETEELCKRYDVRPPARVIALGCSSYEPEIPF